MPQNPHQNKLNGSANTSQVAIVHDYFNQFGGAEKVVEVWLELFPEATLFTSIFIPQHFTSSPAITKAWQEGRVRTSFLQAFFVKGKGSEATPRFTLKFFKHLFWLFPIAMSFLTVSDYLTVLISSTYCAKNVRIIPTHFNSVLSALAPTESSDDEPQKPFSLVHYCHSPTRFLHGLVTETDHASLGIAYRILIPFFSWWLKIIDLRAVKNLNLLGCVWLANSEFIRTTIKQVYGTQSTVVFPPIELDRFLSLNRQPHYASPFYLCHGRISFHKRIDLAILACLKLRKKLKISGSSGLPHEMEVLKKIVSDAEQKDPTLSGLIQFLGRTNDAQLAQLTQECRAFLFPGKEDFGIAPIEMLAAGVPLIAYQAGGALEYVVGRKNGVFFADQTVESLTTAIQLFETIPTWNTAEIKNSSLTFSRKAHEDGIIRAIDVNDN